jgi:hypothetical protein
MKIYKKVTNKFDPMNVSEQRSLNNYKLLAEDT